VVALVGLVVALLGPRSRLTCLAALKSVIGSLDHLKQIVAVHGLVNSTGGINSPEWERRQRWYGFHEKEYA